MNTRLKGPLRVCEHRVDAMDSDLADSDLVRRTVDRLVTILTEKHDTVAALEAHHVLADEVGALATVALRPSTDR